MSAPALAETGAGDVSTGWGVAALSGVMLVSSLGISIANVALPAIADAFSASF